MGRRLQGEIFNLLSETLRGEEFHFAGSYELFVYKYVDETARLPCWPPRGQQVSHQSWILGHCMQMMKPTSEGIHPSFKTQGRHHHTSKTGVAPQKGFMCCRFFLKTTVWRNTSLLWQHVAMTSLTVGLHQDLLYKVEYFIEKFWITYSNLLMWSIVFHSQGI